MVVWFGFKQAIVIC